MIKKIICCLNSWTVTRELFMIPVIYIRDKVSIIFNRKYIKRDKKELKKFCNCHLGERCFIIGNGPSLTAKDLDMIKNEVSFASNRIFDIYPKTQWRPTYYGVQDFYVLDAISEEIEDEETGAKRRFIVGNRINILCRKMTADKKNVFFNLGTCLSENRKIKFSSDISKRVANGRTITYALIQIAVYMGFSEIYLLGIDNSSRNYYKDNLEVDMKLLVQNHFEGSKPYKKLQPWNIKSKNHEFYVATKAYKVAEQYSRAHSCRIYNATRGGCLEEFERVNLEDIMSKKTEDNDRI